MSSTIAGQALFNSGPHRFALRPVGRLWLPPLVIDELQESTQVIATPIELAIIQTGRLVAATESALWALVDTIKGHADSALRGALIDHSGREWDNMTLLRFRPADRLDRGRVISLAYQADYIRLINTAPAKP